jgi:transposase-like protein
MTIKQQCAAAGVSYSHVLTLRHNGMTTEQAIAHVKHPRKTVAAVAREHGIAPSTLYGVADECGCVDEAVGIIKARRERLGR